MYCKNCGMHNQDNAAYCPNCGVPMGVGLHFCGACGAQTDGFAGSCPRCGAPLGNDGAQQQGQQQGYNPYNPPSGSYDNQQQNYQPGGYQNTYPNNGYPTMYSEPKSRLVAGLLGIFVGSLGIHNFYLGYKNRAIWQLLLTTVGSIVTCGVSAGVVAIWAFVEAIMIFTGSIAVDGYGRPLKD